jgi:ATP-binding cassette subfamily B protein
MTVIFVLLGRRIERAYRRVQDQFGDLSATAQENFSGIRVVKAYVQEEHEIAAFGRTNWRYVSHSMHFARLTAGLWPAMSLVSGLSVAALLWVGGNDVIAHRLSIGEFVQFNAYLGQLAWPMIALGWSFNLLQRGDASLTRIREVTERAPAIADRPHPAAARPFAGEIEFQHVSLCYGEHEVLHDISLHIPAGATVAVVGPTGAGKTSLMNLIPRVFDAQRGRVLIDGVDVRDWPLAALRRQIGYVPQETFLFSVPLAENIAYGVESASEAEVEAVAAIAQLSRDVADFPHGYATMIGERGVTLSGGQRQRIAIARAILREAPLLLLDEATSSLDAESETQVSAALARLMQARTTLVIAHRLATVLSCDRILVLDGGRIVEQGTHAQLSAAGGLYARLAKLQFELG